MTADYGIYFLFNCQTTRGCGCTSRSFLCLHAYYVTETVLGVCCTTSAHVKVEFDFLLLFSVFKLEQQQARALGLSRSKVETPSRDRHTCTHPQRNRQVFITGICVKSRYTYQMYAYFLCFLIYVINSGRIRVCVCLCLCYCRELSLPAVVCVGQLAEPVYDLLVV